MRKSVAAAICISLALITSLSAQTAGESAQSSLEYLRRVMDQFHDRVAVYDDVSSAGNHFHAYARIQQDEDHIPHVTINGAWTDNPHSGATASFEKSTAFTGSVLLKRFTNAPAWS